MVTTPLTVWGDKHYSYCILISARACFDMPHDTSASLDRICVFKKIGRLESAAYSTLFKSNKLNFRDGVAWADKGEETRRGVRRCDSWARSGKTTCHIPYIHFTPVKCDSCGTCPPDRSLFALAASRPASQWIQPRPNDTSAAIITYSPAADSRKRRASVLSVPAPHPHRL